MINHAAILKEELKKANLQVNKKHSVIKKEMQKTIEVFENNIPVFPYEVCFGLFKQIYESGSSSNCLAMLPFFQSVINLGFANQSMMDEMLTFLMKSRILPKFSTPESQMKVQQLLILLVSKNSVQFGNLPFVHRLISMLFSLDNAKNILLRRNSVSCIMQIIILLINEARETNAIQDQLIKLIKEFILLSDNVRPEWYPENLMPDRELATHVLAQLVQEPYFKEELPKFEKLLISLISIMSKNLYTLCKSIQNSGNTSPKKGSEHNMQQMVVFYLLYIRCITRSSRLICKQFEFLESVMKLLTNKEYFVFKLLSHQAISYLLNDYKWVHALIESPQNELLYLLLSAELNEVRAICSDERLDLLANQEQSGNFKQLMYSNDTEYLWPDYNHSSELKLIIKDIEEATFSLYSIYQQVHNIALDQKFKGGAIPMTKIFSQIQKIIFEIVKALLPKEMPESLLQSLLKVIQKFINISGCFGDYKVCGVYIKLICKYCLPTEFRLIDYRHVQINKMVLNTANCLGNLLDTSAWIIIWKALENYDSYYNKYLLAKQASQYLHERQNDVQILYQSLDSIFTESTKYDNEYLMTIVDSLVQVTYECLENNFSDEGKKIFSFQRIGQVYRINLNRLCTIWPSLSSSLLCITTSKIPYFRLSALGLLNSLIPLTLSYLHSNPQVLSGKFTPENYQKLIFEPWLNLVKCKFPELKQQIVVALNKIVIDYGHVLTDGWACILEIIKEIGDFKSMQVVIDTFLERVDPYADTVVEIIHQFKSSLTDPNQKYLCLTILWTIGDHSHRVKKLELLERIFGILLEPEYPFVFNPEARHSAFYIFTELLIQNCAEESYEFWERIFGHIQVHVKYVIQQLLKAGDPKIVQQAGKNILLNLVKIYKKFFALISKHNRPHQHQLDFFYNLCASIMALGNTDLYVLTLKQIKQIMTIKLSDTLHLAEFKQLLVALTELYHVSTDLKLMKCLVSYMPPDIFDILGKCFVDMSFIFHEIYKLMERIFLLRLEAEEKDVKLLNSRIFFEEKLIIELIKNFVKTVLDTSVRVRPAEESQNKPESITEITLKQDSSREKLLYLDLFSSNFLMTLEKLLLYEDYMFIMKFLPYAIQLLTHLIEEDTPDLPDKYLSFIQKLMLTKYNLGLLKKMNKKDIPVWHYATQQLIKLCTDWTKTNNFKRALQAYALFQQFLAARQESSEMLLKNTNAETLALYFQNEVFLLNYMLDEFILSLNFREISISEINTFAETIYNKASIDDSDSNMANYSRMNLQLLFKLCQRRLDVYQSPSDQSLIMSRTACFLLFLIKRATDIFQNFFANEKKFGSLPVNQKCVSEVVFLLTKIQKLQLSDNVFLSLDLKESESHGLQFELIKKAKGNKLMKGKYAHIVYFHKTLVSCVRSKESEVRDKVGNLFEIVNSLIVDMSEQ